MAGAAAPSPLAGQDSLPPRVQLSVEPAPLMQGTVRWLVVQLQWDSLLGGTVAGEPIHFEPSPGGQFGQYRGIVGVPVAAPESLVVTLELGDGDGVGTVQAAMPVVAANYPRETIRVAPAFAKPNAAAAARIERENARSRQVSLASRSRPRLWNGPFQIPRTARTTSAFGAARVYNGEVKSRHTGTDFAGAVGAPVSAAGRGVVALVADFYLAGRAVYIDHGAGLVTAYFHLSRADVAQGDTVAAGQRIGAVGQSGRVTGPHLHWVARYGIISVDPMSLLELETAVTDSVTKDSLSQTFLRSGQAP
jgi:murein DD-endopeptidase MepM/ murein hydrolase activator NlpD